MRRFIFLLFSCIKYNCFLFSHTKSHFLFMIIWLFGHCTLDCSWYKVLSLPFFMLINQSISDTFFEISGLCTPELMRDMSNIENSLGPYKTITSQCNTKAIWLIHHLSQLKVLQNPPKYNSIANKAWLIVSQIWKNHYNREAYRFTLLFKWRETKWKEEEQGEILKYICEKKESLLYIGSGQVQCKGLFW